jgi:hypothetical protein
MTGPGTYGGELSAERSIEKQVVMAFVTLEAFVG